MVAIYGAPRALADPLCASTNARETPFPYAPGRRSGSSFAYGLRRADANEMGFPAPTAWAPGLRPSPATGPLGRAWAGRRDAVRPHAGGSPYGLRPSQGWERCAGLRAERPCPTLANLTACLRPAGLVAWPPFVAHLTVSDCALRLPQNGGAGCGQPLLLAPWRATAIDGPSRAPNCPPRSPS